MASRRPAPRNGLRAADALAACRGVLQETWKLAGSAFRTTLSQLLTRALVKSETHGSKYVDWSTGIYLVSADARIKIMSAVEKILRVDSQLVDPAPIADAATEKSIAAQANRVGIIYELGTDVTSSDTGYDAGLPQFRQPEIRHMPIGEARPESSQVDRPVCRKVIIKAWQRVPVVSHGRDSPAQVAGRVKVNSSRGLPARLFKLLVGG